MKNLLLLFPVLLFSVMPVEAGLLAGPPSPAVFAITVDGFTVFATPTFATHTAGADTLYDFTAGASLAGVAVTITGTFNPDPWLDWQVELFNANSSISTIEVGVSLGAAGGPYNTMTSSLSGQLKDTNANGGGAINVSHVPIIGLLNQEPLRQGSDCVILNVSTPNATYGCGSYGPLSAAVATAVAPPIGFVFQARITPLDLITYQGRIEVIDSTAPEIPEPGTWVLFATGGLLFAAGGISRRFK